MTQCSKVLAQCMSVRPQLCYLETEINLCRNQEDFLIKLVVYALRLSTLCLNRGGRGGWAFSHLWQLCEQSCSPVVSCHSMLCFPWDALKPKHFYIAFLCKSNVFPNWQERWVPSSTKVNVNHTASMTAVMLMLILMSFHQLSMDDGCAKTVCHTTTGAFYSCEIWTSSCVLSGVNTVEGKHLRVMWLWKN